MTIKDRPPAELTACPTRPAAFPEDQAATLPPAWRAALIGLAGAYAAVSSQLERLIEWSAPGSCAPPIATGK